jgi:negative regulator of flagellin synthesis FlgM
MQVYGPAHLHGPQSPSAPHAARINQAPSSSPSGSIQDELQISDAGRLMEQAGAMPDIRWDRVNQLRAQIAQGTYETDDKMQVALGKLLDEIG